METKTKEELTSMDIPELVSYVANLTAEVEHKDDEHKQALKAQDEEHKKETEDAKKAQEEHDEEKKKDAAKLAAVLKAMDEDDHEKREAMIKSAMEDDEEHKKDAKKAEHEEDEEKKALKAEVTYLASLVKKPKIDYLTSVYQASNTPKNTLNEYIADWNRKSSKQLDAEIAKTQHLAEVIATPTEDKPFGFSGATLHPAGQEFSASKDFEKIEKMSPSEAFSGVA
jgi:hypothetical protein